MRRHDIERQLRDAGEQAGEQVRHYASTASDNAQALMERGRRRIHERFGDSGAYRRRLSRAVEDLADETHYRYRRARRHVERHPLATAAIVAGTIGAFLLLRRALRSDRDD